ncbi:Microtubule-associated protein 10, partial [Sciurus carolinensis]|nr:Microtubule-associated protein 10 [Sciurus carolinensis]
FRLLDFAPLLVRAPSRPTTLPGGALGFGRGKACVFHLRPAALRRPRLRAVSGLAVQRLLGACDVPLPAAGGPGRRGTFALLDPAGRRIGDLALFCRWTAASVTPPARPPPPSAPRTAVPGTPRGGTRTAAPAALDPAAAGEGAPSPARAVCAENRKPDPAEAADSSVSTISTSSEENPSRTWKPTPFALLLCITLT